jgi:hypothetical protein
MLNPICEHCGYNLAGAHFADGATRCPECGGLATGVVRKRAWRRSAVIAIVPTLGLLGVGVVSAFAAGDRSSGLAPLVMFLVVCGSGTITPLVGAAVELSGPGGGELVPAFGICLLGWLVGAASAGAMFMAIFLFCYRCC